MNRWGLRMLRAWVAGSVVVAVACGRTIDGDSGEPPEPVVVESAPQGVSATKDDPAKVVVRWQPPASALGLREYVVLRDDAELGRVPASASRFEDRTAAPGTFLAPENLTASTGTEQGGVRLSWTAGETAPGPLHRYGVRAVFTTNKVVGSREVEGGRGAPHIDAYELTRDDGATWIAAGASSPFLDVDAPRAPVSIGSPTLAWETPRSLMHVQLTEAPVLGPMPSATYRVRARAGVEVSKPSGSAEGRRASGRIDELLYQWQRSKADRDADYSDLPDVTGRIWVDPAAPAGRYFWRAVVASPWAEGISSGASAIALPFSSLGAGLRGTCGIRSDGTIACWGQSAVKTNVPAGVFKSVAVDAAHACAIRNDDRMVCWGNNEHGEAPPGPSADTFQSISTLGGSTCGLKLDGHVVCFGDQSEPPPPGIFKQITTARHTCGIRADDRIECWAAGEGHASGLPPGPTADAYKFVDTMPQGTCAIRMDDKRVCWGPDSDGFFPTAPSAASFKAISARGSCGLRTDGRLECWRGAANVALPRETFKSMAMDVGHGCGLLVDGRISCWSESMSLEGPTPPYPYLGRTKTVVRRTCRLMMNGAVSCAPGYDSYPPPDDVLTGTFASLTPRSALRADGSVRWWPYVLSLPDRYKFIAADSSGYSACGIRTDDRLSCWGSSAGPLAPTAETFKDVSVAYNLTCAIRSVDDEVLCWGYGGLTGQPTGIKGKRVTAGDYLFFCAIQQDGTRLCNGRGDEAIFAPPTPSTEKFLDVSLDQNARVGCGVRTDGHLTCWGRVDYWGRMIPNDSPYETYKSVTVSTGSVCAIRNDDKVRCWTEPYLDVQQPTMDVLGYN